MIYVCLKTFVHRARVQLVSFVDAHRSRTEIQVQKRSRAGCGSRLHFVPLVATMRNFSLQDKGPFQAARRTPITSYGEGEVRPNKQGDRANASAARHRGALPPLPLLSADRCFEPPPHPQQQSSSYLESEGGHARSLPPAHLQNLRQKS